jgi:identified by metaGeneAnnotator
MKKKGFIWWEKHVEYKFIRDNHILASIPLDGNFHEQAGDSVFTDENKFYLVEFKACNSNKYILQEMNKYPFLENEEVKHEISTNEKRSEFEKIYFQKFQEQKNNCCHFIVYGDVFGNKEEKPYWGIEKKEYLSFLFPEKLQNNGSTNLCGVEYSQFIKYLAFIISQKSGTKISVDESSGSFANVLVITQDNQAILFSDVINVPKVQQDLKNNGIEIHNDHSEENTASDENTAKLEDSSHDNNHNNNFGCLGM